VTDSRSGEDVSAVRRMAAFLASPWALLLAVLLAFFLNSASLPLTDVDEGAFSEATREMMASGNLVSPMLNGQPRHDKPILIYWAQAASVSLLGEREIGFRLPSLLATLAWLGALVAFCCRHGDRSTAQVAGLVMALSLMVGVVAKAAIADALLNLFISLAFFAIYDLHAAGGTLPRRALVLLYAGLGLGFLTKGPVAVLLPGLVGTLFFVLDGQWRRWLKVVFWWPGWLIWLAIVLPWHILVYLDQGFAFFEGFYLHHNLARYTKTFEGHGGNLFYYVPILPLVLMPFAGWLLGALPAIWRTVRPGSAAPGAALERFLLLWFVVAFVLFSTSRTQLPHYILYGCAPLFILLARYREAGPRWLAFLPPLAFALLLVGLPLLISQALPGLRGAHEQGLAEALLRALDGSAPFFGAYLVLLAALAVWRRLPAWQGLLLGGLVQAAVFFGCLVPAVLSVTQGPVKGAAEATRELPGEVVAYRIYQPSFSLYRAAITPTRTPQAGEYALLRADRVADLAAEVAPARLEEVFAQGYIRVVRVSGAAE